MSGADNRKDATLLTPQEREGLISPHVTLARELNEAEQANILVAATWVFARKRDVFDESFLRALHRRMFDKVWRWAGEFRTTPSDVGVAPLRIAPELERVIADAKGWASHSTYMPDEIAVRYHHALVWVHPFPNGNARWSRLVGDATAVALGRVPFSWGRKTVHGLGEARSAYLDALRAADRHDFAPLIRFSRS